MHSSTLERVKVEALPYDDRRVYSVAAFNRGVASWLERLPTLWVEGEVTELRRHERWQTVFFTLKDPEDGACLPVTMPREPFDALRLDLQDGERVHVFGRPALFEARGDFRLRALSVERFGVGRHLAELERLKAKLAAEGLFAESRKRPLPRFPRAVGLVTGNDAAAKHDVLTAIQARFPAARVVVCETLVQGPRAAAALVDALRDVAAEPGVEVVILARGGGSFEDLLPFSDERVVRAVAACPVPSSRRSATSRTRRCATSRPTCARRRPPSAAELVVPDVAELRAALDRGRVLARALRRRALERERGRTAGCATARPRPGRSARAAAQPRIRSRRPARAGARRGSRASSSAGRPRGSPAAGSLAARDARARLRDRARGGAHRARRRRLAPATRSAVEVAGGAFEARVEEVR